MAHDDDNDDDGNRQLPSSDARPGFRSRLTLNFKGPPLSLPEEPETTTPAAKPRATAALILDTGELADEDDEARRSVLPPPPPAEPEELSLDLTDIGPGEGGVVDGRDAWAMDRRARQSTRPPPASFAGRPRTNPSLRRLPSRPPGPPGDARPEDALQLVDRKRPSASGIDLASEMADRFALGDFTGALRVAELLLGRDPANDDARRYASTSTERLEQIYSSRLGSLARIPSVTGPESEIRWMGLDPQAALLLSRVDGKKTFEEIISNPGMPRLVALKTLVDLLETGVIEVT